MKQCPYCGAQLQDDARACNNCGRPMPETADTGESRIPEAETAGTRMPETVPEQAPLPKNEEPARAPQEAPDSWQRRWTQQDEQNGQQPMWGQQDQRSGQQPARGPQDPRGGPYGWGQQGPVYGRQPGAYPPGGMPPAGYGMRVPGQDRVDPLAVISLVLGIAAIFLNAFFLIPSILAIVLGIVAVLRIRKYPDVYGGSLFAILGIVLGIVLLIVYAFVFAQVFQMMQDPEKYDELMQLVQQFGGGAK